MSPDRTGWLNVYMPQIYHFFDLLSMEPWAAAKKLLSNVASVRVPSQRPLAPCIPSVTSGDKGYNEMILWLCTDFLAFAAELRKTTEILS